MRIRLVYCLTMILCTSFGYIDSKAQSDSKSVKPGINYKPRLKDDEKTKILILATPHLRNLQCFKPGALQPLLGILQKFNPDVIGLETLPPAILEDMEKRGGNFDKVIAIFAKARLEVGHKMQKTLNVARVEAESKADALLKEKSLLSAAARRQLIAYLLAAYDYNSAVLQYSYLDENERQPDALLPQEVLARLNESLSSANESFSIGVALAKRLKLQKVVGIDDQMDADLFFKMDEKGLEEVENHPETKASKGAKFYAESDKRLKAACANGEEMLRHYLYVNSPEFAAKDVSLQWGKYFRMKVSSEVNRDRMLQWEVRNLNIASHIRKAMFSHSGKRMLVIIGASHKPFLDSYLGQMLDVKLVQLSKLTADGGYKQKRVKKS